MFDLQNMWESLAPVRNEYRNEVRAMARDIIEECQKGEVDDVYDRLHECVDGSWWVTYTYAAQAVCLVSDNDGAWEELGAESIVSDGVLRWEAMAYCAIRQDVLESIEVEAPEGFDMNDPDTWAADNERAES